MDKKLAVIFPGIGYHVDKPKGIVFHGTGDDWAKTEVIKEECEKRGLPLYLTENANHSMETGDVLRDIEILRKIMQSTEEYIKVVAQK